MKMLNLTHKKRAWLTRKARYMLEADQIVTGLCDSVDLPGGFVAKYKVAVKAVFSRFKAKKRVSAYSTIGWSGQNHAHNHFLNTNVALGKDFQPFNALEVDILTYGGAGRGLTEG